MNITFMIGNGFDLRLGMRTRYTDMYSHYINGVANNPVVQEFKETLENDAPNGYKTWGDFEMAMARHAQTFDNEDAFIACVRDFKEYMAGYLQQEQEIFLSMANASGGLAVCAQEMKKSLESFYMGQIPNVINEINNLKRGNFIENHFISFNYTTVFDFLLTRYSTYFKEKNTNNVVHVHGSLDGDIVLGIDNHIQFENLKFPVTRRLERAFVKPSYNYSFDKARFELAEELIDNSHIICIYGMSLGKSDETWIYKIRNWLLANSDHHLIYYVYSDQVFSSWKRDEIMDEEESQKQKLLSRIFESVEDIEKVFNQVHIPVGFNIFDFKNQLENMPKDKHIIPSRLPAGTP